MPPKLLIEILGTISDGVFTPAPLVVSVRTTDERILVGRRLDAQMDVRLNLYLSSYTVSPRHALIFFKDEAWHIRDLGSENGTWIYNDNAAASLTPDYLQELVIDDKLEVVFGRVVARLTVHKE